MATKREAEWASLYTALRSVLVRHGRECPFGENGDFWLVDDDWGGKLQKVYVFKMRFLAPSLVADIQSLLLNSFREWGVLFALDVKNSDGEKSAPEGIIVFASSVERHWQENELRKLFGPDFLW